MGRCGPGNAYDFPILDALRIHVTPRSRHGDRFPLDPFFTTLTGIAEETIERDGVPLDHALKKAKDFASGVKFWSWGKDEFNMVAISCYVEGMTPPLPATQFGNACHLLLKAGMPYEDMKMTPSNRLADYFKVDHPPLRGHDALDDARSVAYVIQHLLRHKALQPPDLA